MSVAPKMGVASIIVPMYRIEYTSVAIIMLITLASLFPYADHMISEGDGAGVIYQSLSENLSPLVLISGSYFTSFLNNF